MSRTVVAVITRKVEIEDDSEYGNMSDEELVKFFKDDYDGGYIDDWRWDSEDGKFSVEGS